MSDGSDSGATSVPSDLTGAWKLLSAHVEFADNGERRNTFGPEPSGWIVFTENGRMMGLITRAGRSDPMDQADYRDAFVSMVAYSGRIEFVGDCTFVNHVDTSWQPGWVGTDQMRHFDLEGERLIIRTAEQTLPIFGARRLVSVVEWTRSD